MSIEWYIEIIVQNNEWSVSRDSLPWSRTIGMTDLNLRLYTWILWKLPTLLFTLSCVGLTSLSTCFSIVVYIVLWHLWFRSPSLLHETYISCSPLRIMTSNIFEVLHPGYSTQCDLLFTDVHLWDCLHETRLSRRLSPLPLSRTIWPRC